MMSLYNKLVEEYFNVKYISSEDARRRRLLNILVGGVIIITLLVPVPILLTAEAAEAWEVNFLLISDIVLLGGTLIIYLINRFGSGPLASLLFILFLTIVLALSDTPEEVVQGRSLFFMAIPILMGSVLLRPYASFLLAIVSSIVINVIALENGFQLNIIAPFGFVIVALVSWLSARSLEQALLKLSTINQELDQRVADRTHDLQKSLTREQEESSKNQAILESIADGVIFFDNNNKILVANPSLIGLITRDDDNIEGKTLKQLMMENVSADAQEQLQEYLLSSEKQKASIPVEWGNKTVSISFAPVMTTDRNRIGSVMVCRDFTREVELDRLKDRFLSMTSHELRTPLNAILGYADMIQALVLGDLTPRQDETMNRISANAKRMLGLINNILDQAHIDVGTISVRPADLPLQQLVEDIYSVTSVLAEHRQLKFTIEVEDNVPTTIISDEQRLNQILVNLVGNAIKFTKEGHVTLRIYRLDNQYISFDISDTGVGIPLNAQQHIFDAFWQVDDPRTREIGGSGLGLSIVKQLVHLLEGTITLISEVNEGTTFTVTIPLNLTLEDPLKEKIT